MQQGDKTYPGLYRAIAVDYNDPENLGRIRMIVPQVFGEQITDWAWPVLGGISQVKPIYGEWQDDLTQSITSTTTAYPTLFRVNDGSNGISVVDNSKVTFEHAGIYNIQFSFQFQNTDSQLHDVQIWLSKNGVNVPGSSGFVSVPNKHGSVNGHTIAAWNYAYKFAAGDYFQIMWQADSTQVTMEAYAAGTTPATPNTASSILTVTAVGNVLPKTQMGVWAAFEGGDPNYPLWIGTF